MVHMHGGHPPVVHAATVVPARRVAPATSLVPRPPAAVFGPSQVGQRWLGPLSMLFELVLFAIYTLLHPSPSIRHVRPWPQLRCGGISRRHTFFGSGIVQKRTDFLCCAGCLGVGLSIFLFPNRIFHSCWLHSEMSDGLAVGLGLFFFIHSDRHGMQSSHGPTCVGFCSIAPCCFHRLLKRAHNSHREQILV